MLGKLMKYEFKATGRIFVPLFSALLIVSAVTRLMGSLRSTAPHVIGVTLASMLIAAAFVITLILTIQRFYKNFMTNEGYLMFTLPVNTDRLIWAKLIVATVWTLVCGAVVSLSIAIMSTSDTSLLHIFRSNADWSMLTLDEGLFSVELIAIFLVTLLDGILSLYACMALSLYFNKHRIAISFAIYVGMIILFQILAVIAASIISNANISINEGLRVFIDTHPNGTVHMALLLALLIIAAVGAAFFALTRHMLKNKLNLQ
ncbi:MAG TPA: hypothetical protein PK537_07655 [Candidatus Limiplasma sp.]|nr:hypothetical protein [Candidatus Limiplasma sp.]